MNNEMRDKLIIKILQALEDYRFRDGTHPIGCAECVADTLIAAGVIFPKFRVGQEVWHIIADGNNNFYIEGGWQYIAECKDKAVLCYPKEKGYRSKKIKRKDWVFATEAEARAALEGKE